MNNSKQNGFSYIEVLITTIIMSISLAPALNALSSNTSIFNNLESVQASFDTDTDAMEKLLSFGYKNIYNKASLTNSHTTASTSSSNNAIYIGFYDLANLDGDNNVKTIKDDDLDADSNPFTGDNSYVDTLWIRLKNNEYNHNITTIMTQSYIQY